MKYTKEELKDALDVASRRNLSLVRYLEETHQWDNYLQWLFNESKENNDETK